MEIMPLQILLKEIARHFNLYEYVRSQLGIQYQACT